MPLIKEIRDLQNQGKNDSEIFSEMSRRGYSPRDIDESLSQSRVKAAVSQESPIPTLSEDMQPSSMQQDFYQPPQQQQQPSQPEILAPSPGMPSQGYADYSQPSSYSGDYGGGFSSNNYPANYDYSQEYASQGVSSDTVSEIVEEIAEEKVSKVRNELAKMEDFKTDTETKLELLKDRIRRIEGIIDSLQDSIIRKIGDYGENIQHLGQEIQATQDSFSKVISPLLEKRSYSVSSLTSRKPKKYSGRKKRK